MSHISEQTDNHNAIEGLIPSSSWGVNVSADSKVIEERILDIKNKIAPYKPRIIAITKYYGLDAVINGYEAGLREFGESRAVDAVKKIGQLSQEIRVNSIFHFIGHLQTNKAEMVVKNFDYIHSVDSLKVAQAISKSACRLDKRERVLLQVNLACEEQKFGYERERLKSEFSEIINLDALDVVGLMCMAPFGAKEDELCEIFSGLREFRDELETEFGVKLPELSMGMSDDYEIAVQEGATMIRLGRKLFK